MPVRGARSIFKKMEVVSFEKIEVETKKQAYSHITKCLDVLSAQMDCVYHLITKNIFTYKELCKSVIEQEKFQANLLGFIQFCILPKYNKNKGKNADRLCVSKEDKE